MKVGDFANDNYPSRSHLNKIGVLVDEARLGSPRLTKAFNVSWQNGTIRHTVWDYDLKVIYEKSLAFQ